MATYTVQFKPSSTSVTQQLKVEGETWGQMAQDFSRKSGGHGTDEFYSLFLRLDDPTQLYSYHALPKNTDRYIHLQDYIGEQTKI